MMDNVLKWVAQSLYHPSGGICPEGYIVYPIGMFVQVKQLWGLSASFDLYGIQVQV